MKDRDRYLKYPTIIIYLILSGLFIYSGDFKLTVIAIIALGIIGVILYIDIKNKRL